MTGPRSTLMADLVEMKIKLHPGDADTLMRLAKAKGISRTAVVREALRLYELANETER